MTTPPVGVERPCWAAVSLSSSAFFPAGRSLPGRGRIHRRTSSSRGSLLLHRCSTDPRRRDRNHTSDAIRDYSRREHAGTLSGPHFACDPAFRRRHFQFRSGKAKIGSRGSPRWLRNISPSPPNLRQPSRESRAFTHTMKKKTSPWLKVPLVRFRG